MSDTYILRLPGVIERTGLSRSTLYSKIASGEFPRSIQLSQRAVGWTASEIEAWLAARIAETRRTRT
jgi:prophage regulatory protein